jgi:hypothetical protein
MVLSSDKLSGLGKPIVQLKLDVSTDGGNVVENVAELDLNELNALLKVLKQAQAVGNPLLFFSYLCSGQRVISLRAIGCDF